MKRLAVLLALTFAVAAPGVLAQQQQPCEQAKQPCCEQSKAEKPAQPAQKAAKAPAAGRIVELTAKLELTKEQQASVQKVLSSEATAIRAARADTSLDAKKQQAKISEIKQSHAASVRALLTEEQQKKYDEMKQRPAPRQPAKKPAK